MTPLDRRRAAEAAAIRAYANRASRRRWTTARRHRGRRSQRRIRGGDDAAARTTGLGGRHAGVRPADQGDEQRLWNSAQLIPEAQRFSRVHRGRGELIDHLLLSHVMVKAVEMVTTGEIDVPSITEQPREQRDKPRITGPGAI